MIAGVPLESYPGERRVALVPGVIPMLAKAGIEVVVQKGAGVAAGFPDADYEAKGARLGADRGQVFSTVDVVLVVHGPDGGSGAPAGELDALRPAQMVIGLLNPLGAPQVARELATRRATAFALELLPRISRAQSMDVLSSMASLAGYKAVLLAATALDKIYPLMMTAAGTITPSRTLVIGAGVAGLQAIATSRRLGSVVTAYDVRPAVKEQVVSLGAKFLEMQLETASAEGAGGYARAMGEEFYRRQRELMAGAVAESDAVITTAAVPGEKAPVLVTEDMVRGMRSGAVIVDLAAETGGNCALTRPGETTKVEGVTIIGPVNLAASLPYHASQMYARNVTAFLQNLVKDGRMQLDSDDEIIRASLLTHGGEVVNPRVRKLLGLPDDAAPPASAQSA